MTAEDCRHHDCYATESCPCQCHANQRRPHVSLDWRGILARATAEAQRQARARGISGDRYEFLALDDDA